MIDGELLKKLIDGAAQYESVVVNQTADLIDQTLKYFVFESLLNILSSASIFLLLYIIRRVMGFLIAEEEAHVREMKALMLEASLDTRIQSGSVRDESNSLRAWRLGITIVAIGIFLFTSVPHIKAIGKIMIAPKLFIIEQAAKVVSGEKKEVNK